MSEVDSKKDFSSSENRFSELRVRLPRDLISSVRTISGYESVSSPAVVAAALSEFFERYPFLEYNRRKL